MVIENSKRAPTECEIIIKILCYCLLFAWAFFVLCYNYNIRELEVYERTFESRPYQELEKRVRLLEEKVKE